MTMGTFTVSWYKDHTYARIDEGGRNWNEAKQYCEALGGHLVVIRSEKVQKFIESLIEDGSMNMYWLGASMNKKGVFKWVNGTSLKYTNWDTNQPDNYLKKEKYLEIFRIRNPKDRKTHAYAWNDAPLNNTLSKSDFFTINTIGLICEWDEILSEIPGAGTTVEEKRAAGNSANPWPERELTGPSTALRPATDDGMRRQAYYGPGTNYARAGGYKPGKVRSATALFREGDFILVDLDYQSTGKRCVYFKTNLLTNTDAENVTLAGYPARTLSEIPPRRGPGADYDTVELTTENKDTGASITERVVLVSGSEITVFFEIDGWVFAEFNCNKGLIRAWLPADDVQAE